jgi:hypothetical protein
MGAIFLILEGLVSERLAAASNIVTGRLLEQMTSLKIVFSSWHC